MINLSESAKKCLDRYLQQVRTYLRGCKTVDAGEVERNVIEHIESEFASATAAVSFEDFDTVLQKLGSPQQWIPEEELPWWRKIIFRLRSGPEDWRLAYLSFGLLVCGFLLPWMLPVLVPASFIVSRAALAATDYRVDKGQKWLLYPPLMIVYFFLAAAILLLPLGALAPVAYEVEDEIREFYRIADDTTYWVLACSAFGMLTGLWWVLCSTVLFIWPSLPKKIFRPLADWLNRKWAALLLLVGLVIIVLSFLVCLWMINTGL
jgi:hypothetical protein